ncbi:hypothetical protein, partial [Endozoicomonas sp. YOMI1]|uniref:hypothetical protein n=1 Tax=Endozoicomonas sp. YOMI1 TaxID=2828739 RepID=UPI002148F2D3
PACAARPDWARVYDDFANDRYDDAEHLIGIIVGTGTTLTDEVQGKLSGALERAIDNDRYDDAERLHRKNNFLMLWL